MIRVLMFYQPPKNKLQLSGLDNDAAGMRPEWMEDASRIYFFAG